MATVEICLDADSASLQNNVASVLQAGAHRIELCRNMAEQGLTPTIEQIQSVKSQLEQSKSTIELLIMLRPRPGNFVYNEAEKQLMLNQLQQITDCRVDGIVFGALTSTQQIDQPFVNTLVTLAQQAKLKVSFHRAFDALNEPNQALKQLADLGIDRLLTSGTPWHSGLPATDGLPVLQQLVTLATGVEIVIGGGVQPNNANMLTTALNQTASNKGQYSLHAFSGVLQEQDVAPSLVQALITS